MIYPVILPALQRSFGLSDTLAGLLITVLWFFYAVGQLPAGVLADRPDERTVLTLTMLVVAVSLGGVVSAPSVGILFATTAVCGLTIALFHIPRILLLTDLYDDNLGSAFGITLAIGDLGQTAIPPIAGVVTVAVAWQAGLGGTIPFFVLTGVAIWLTLADRSGSTAASEDPADPAQSSTSSLHIRPILREMRRPPVLFVIGMFFLYVFIWQSFTAFYPSYLIDQKELSPTGASLLFGLFFATGIAIKPLSGAAYDRFGIRATLIGLLLSPAIGFLLLPFLQSTVALVGLTALLSTSLGTGTVTQSWLSETFPEATRGTGLGVVNTLTIGLAAGGPVLFGVIAEYDYLNQGYIGLACIIAVSLGVTLWMPEL
jgi:MFS family permease